MAAFPFHRPHKLSLGHLEREVLEWIWRLGTPTVKEIYEQLLADPERELAYSSLTTVLRRLEKKGWLAVDKRGRSLVWRALISAQETQALEAYQQLHRFLAVGNEAAVAAFASEMDAASVEKLAAIAQQLQALREAQP
jgi:predicted transcriptional regulator